MRIYDSTVQSCDHGESKVMNEWMDEIEECECQMKMRSNSIVRKVFSGGDDGGSGYPCFHV